MGGIASGIPIPLNKLAFMAYKGDAEAPAATEAPVPGFGLLISILALTAVAYMVLTRKKH